MKKWIAIVAGVVLLGTIGFVIFDRLSGGHRLENWIGSVVVGITNSYLIPDISYEEIAYTAPGQVDLGGVAFTAPDGTRIIEIEQFSLTLAELPKRGQPLLIERVEIRHGTINIKQNPETGEILGLVPLLENELTDEYQVEIEGARSEFKLSDTLQLREIVIDDVDLSYDDGSGTPLILDDISIASEISPETLDGQQGWYSLDISMDRGESFKLSVPGHLNLDSMVARVASGSLVAELNDETIKSLPAALQSMMTEYQATGSLDVRFEGTVPLTDPTNGLLTTDITLESFHLTQGDYVFPIDSLVIQAGLADGNVSVSKLRAETIGGTVDANALLPLSGEPANAAWTVEGLDLAQLMSAQADDSQSKLAGILASGGEFGVRIDQIPESIGGGGTLQVRKGRLMRIPGLAELAAVMNVVMSGDTKPNHKVDVEFEFAPEGIRVAESEILTGFLAARGTGLIDYTGNLDLAVNAGPLERLQSVLGSVGDVLGQITDQIMTYNVKGPIGDPKVTTSVGKSGKKQEDQDGD